MLLREMCGSIWEVLGKTEEYRIIWGDLSERNHLVEMGIHKMKLIQLIFKE